MKITIDLTSKELADFLKELSTTKLIEQIINGKNKLSTNDINLYSHSQEIYRLNMKGWYIWQIWEFSKFKKIMF